MQLSPKGAPPATINRVLARTPNKLVLDACPPLKLLQHLQEQQAKNTTAYRL
jgi:hypothetical protein